MFQLKEILDKLGDLTKTLDGNYNFKIIDVDDETYATSNEPLPHC